MNKVNNVKSTKFVKNILKLSGALLHYHFLTIFILCGESPIFAIHGWLTGALVENSLAAFL
jgi:hypothetical protein